MHHSKIRLNNSVSIVRPPLKKLKTLVPNPLIYERSLFISFEYLGGLSNVLFFNNAPLNRYKR